MRAAACLTAALWIAAVPALAAPDPLPQRRIVLTEATDLPGGDLSALLNTALEACVATCLADPACTAMTWNATARACFPKSAAGAPIAFDGALSGRVLETPAAATEAARARIAAAGFLRDEDVAALHRQAAGLGALYPLAGTAEDARAAASAAAAGNDPEAVVRWMGAATAASDDPADWLSLAQWLASGTGDDARKDAAIAAALNAWLRDPGPGTAALRLFADLAEGRGRGRDGLAALRLAATTDADPDLAGQLAAFEERHGFRVTDTRVEADSAAPRACLSMSAEVASGVDLAPFVALPAPTLAVEAQGAEVCITGLAHGAEATVTLRAGLPAADGDRLARDVTQTLYVRDRAPQVRFPGRGYVLPATGDQGLTLQAVNADRVDLTLWRLSERNLVRALRSELFGLPITGWKLDTFEDSVGAKVWEGEADLARLPGGAAPEVNAEHASRLDVAGAAGPLAPGVYALTAAIPGADADRSPPATQWFLISDLGLTAWSGADGLAVAVLGLSDAAPRAGVEVALVSRGNAVLGTAVTGADGIARFDAGLARGRDAAAPAMVTASVTEGGTLRDQTFLSLLDPEFDLSDRGVEGNPPAPPVDLFVATDRGAYRAGETVHATILARDAQARALPGLPLTAVILRPDGVEHARFLPPEAGAGGHVLAFELTATAPRGAWRIDLRLEEDGPPLASTRILVEDFRPERIDVTLAADAAPLPATAALPVGLTARWLYGAPGATLPVEAELRLAPATTLPGWEGWVFGRHDAPDETIFAALPEAVTDAEGGFAGTIPLPPAAAQATGPLAARLSVAVREGAGRPVSRSSERIVLPARAVPGLRPLFADGAVAEGTEAAFEAIALGPDLAPVATEATWTLNRVLTDYQWYALDGEWMWEPVTTRERIASGTVTLGPDPARIAAPVAWGEYELVVQTADGGTVSTGFSAGWGAATAGTDTPDRLRVTLDRPAYAAGDTATLTLQAQADGTALVAVLSNRIVALQAVAVTAGETRVTLPVTDDWGAGVYIAASVVRPVGADAGQAPIRALGVVPAGVAPGDRALAATLEAPAEADPRGALPVTLHVTGGAPGETVHATLAAIDQGILNLTRHTPPDPSAHYFGQRRLGVGLRDLYGRLILPSGAADGAIRAGGDAAMAALQAPPPTEKLMAFFSGPLVVGADGTVTVDVPLPDFNGEVRLSAVVWSDRAVGQADATVLVRDPVVMTVTAPASLAPGDTAQASLRLTHAAGPAGPVALSLDAQGIGTGALPEAVVLAEGASETVTLPLTAPEAEGVARVTLAAVLPDGRRITKDLALSIARLDSAVTRSARVTVAPGASATLDAAALGPFRPGGTARLASGAAAQLDLGAALARLETWPYGCTEQIASGLLPALSAGLTQADPDTVAAGIARLLTRQASDGGFGLWDATSGDPWLDAYATDVLAQARAAGHAVPDAALERAFANLRNRLNQGVEAQYAEAHEAAARAYAQWVLAREGRGVVADLRYDADTAGAAFGNPLAAAQMGAALAAMGDVGRADRMFAQAQAALDAPAPEGFRLDYGSALRDAAGVLALAAGAGTQAVDRVALATRISALVAAREAEGAGLSTQEAGALVLAADAVGRDPSGLTRDGAPLPPVLALASDAAVTVQNPTAAPIVATLSVTAVPEVAPPAGGTAWRIARRWVTPEGAPVDPTQPIARGTRLVAVIEVTPLPGFGAGGRLVVTDPLPAGIEIENPALIAAGEIAALPWLDSLAEVEMAEFRQDRFAAAVTWTSEAPFTLAYRARAVTPGEYAAPAASVEDMYRPAHRGWTDAGRVTVAP